MERDLPKQQLLRRLNKRPMSPKGLTSVNKPVILNSLPNPNNKEAQMSETQTPTISRKEEQLLRDQSTWETYVSVGNWVEVAKQMNYANGSCARRAGLRHAFLHSLLVQGDNPQVV
jgi:hypothetical protein